MKKLIRLSESDLTRIVRRVIKEQEEENSETKFLSEQQWVDVWFGLRKLTKSFHFPDYGLFVFGGLFFYYNEEEGCLVLEPQKLTDWRNDPSDAADVLDNYVNRIRDYFNEYNNGNDIQLSLEVGRSYSMKICAH